MMPSPKCVKTRRRTECINDMSEVTAVLQGQDVVGVSQLAFLCGGNSVSVTQRSVAVRVLKWRVMLSVA